MQIVYQRCCGLDVHKDSITACLLIREEGGRKREEIRRFGTMTVDLLGLCPGNNESAGKRRSGKTRKGSVWLRRTLCQAAWAASRTRKTYLSALFKRLSAKKGVKRAIVAVAHAILVIVYHMLKEKTAYQDLGYDYFEKKQAPALQRYYVGKLEKMGFQVTVQTAQAPALAG